MSLSLARKPRGTCTRFKPALKLPGHYSYLVRDAVRKGNVLNIVGDLSESTSLLVFAPPDIESVLWTGQDVGAKKNDWNAWEADLAGPESLGPVTVTYGPWRYADSLPEIGDFDDSDWVNANHTSTREYIVIFHKLYWLLISTIRSELAQAVQELQGQGRTLRARLWVSSGQPALPRPL